MWSFASTPGKCLVMPRSSSTVVAAAIGCAILLTFRRSEKGGCSPALPVTTRTCRLAVRVRRALHRRLDLAGCHLRRDCERGGDLCLRAVGFDLAETHSAVLGVEEQIVARCELALDQVGDRRVDGDV